MTTFEALFLAIPISLATSTVLVVAMSNSLRAALADSAESHDSVAYWVPFSIAMTYLVPLFVGLVIGVGTIPQAGVFPAVGVTRILASVLGGSLLALAGIGLQLSKHNRRLMHLRWTGPGNTRKSNV